MTITRYLGRHLFFTLCAAAMCATAVRAADIFSNPITDANPSTADPFTAGQNTDPNLTATGIGRGAGIGANSGSNRYNARNWSLSAFDESDYFTWTLTPATGFEIDFNSVSGQWQRSGTGPISYVLRSSLDGFSADVATGDITGNSSAVAYNLDLSSIQDVTSAIEFRLFAYGGTNVAGTFSFNDFTFDGEVVPTGMPTVLAGDFNDNGTVDAADYVVWRSGLATQLQLVNETTSPGVVDAEDYGVWQGNFGAVASSQGASITQSTIVVPEPMSAVLVLCVASAFFVSPRHRHQVFSRCD